MNATDEMLEDELDDILNQEFAKRGKTRCAALVAPASLDLRTAAGSRRCRRAGYVHDHSRVYCQQHAPLWRTHHEIVDRIMEIPPRD